MYVYTMYLINVHASAMTFVDSGGQLQQLIHVESGDEGKTKLTIW